MTWLNLVAVLVFSKSGLWRIMRYIKVKQDTTRYEKVQQGT